MFEWIKQSLQHCCREVCQSLLADNFWVLLIKSLPMVCFKAIWSANCSNNKIAPKLLANIFYIWVNSLIYWCISHSKLIMYLKSYMSGKFDLGRSIWSAIDLPSTKKSVKNRPFRGLGEFWQGWNQNWQHCFNKYWASNTFGWRYIFNWKNSIKTCCVFFCQTVVNNMGRIGYFSNDYTRIFSHV